MTQELNDVCDFGLSIRPKFFFSNFIGELVMKKTLVSIALGLMLSIIPMAIYANQAACPQTIVVNGQTCQLYEGGDGGCSGGVCVCAYHCP
ncbi:MAG: hypothetical protein ACR2LT_06610 [Pyrinomonadaceae bacterium]